MNYHKVSFLASYGLLKQIPPSSKIEIAFAGRSNVGKSSLINALLNRKNLARTSATPGKTATVNFYRLDTMRMVDLPGYGYAKVSASEKKRWNTLIEGYFDADRDLRLVLQLVDMRHPPTGDDRMMIEYLTQREIPFLVVLTKADKLNKTERESRLKALEEELAEYEGLRWVPFSAVTREGVDALRDILISVTEEEDA